MRKLREDHGIFVSGVAYPVVPKGTVLIRLIPTAAHTKEHIQKTLKGFEAIKDEVFERAKEQEKMMA
jgi:glycine C-acetyltransferase